jgi:8-hydroxy-5-deazaflavin:NADPH oxidoreductase
MKIGVIGSGDVGRVLGAGFVGAGHQVKLGSRDPGKKEKVLEWVEQTGPKASAGTFAEAAAFGEVLLLATLWSGTENALKLAGAQNFAGKVVLDATNPLVFHPEKAPELALGNRDSGGEQIQRWLPQAKIVKVFNSVGNAHMVKPDFPGGPPDMFLCGNDEEAKKTAAKLCKELGWPAIDLGSLEASRYLEGLAMIWILHFLRTQTWNHAFKLIRK